jgi:hypothetical protein
MSTTEITFAEIQHSITGFDEIAVQKHMDCDVYEAASTKLTLFRRCLVFIHQRHQGLDDQAAKKVALGMRFKDLFEYFAAEPYDDEDDEPETEVGKGSTSLVFERTDSPGSASAPA